MPLFLGLYLGHVLGDFAFQPGRLVVAKRRGLRGMLVHTAIIVAGTAIVSIGQLHSRWPAVLLAGISHFAIEFVTVHARRVTQATGLAILTLDQALHLASLVLIATLFGRDSVPVLFTQEVSVRLLALTCGGLTVAFMGAILAFEVRTSSHEAARKAAEVLGYDGKRIYGMVERATAFAGAVLAPLPVVGALAFLPRIAYAMTRPPATRAQHLTEAAVGLALCTAVWALLKILSTSTI
ncbi:MAG: DUF3307 domain-containing protein [Thermotogota bacterium]